MATALLQTRSMKEAVMKTILVPLDGSARAEQVLPYAAYLAKLMKARICLLRVVTDVYYGAPSPQDVAVLPEMVGMGRSALPAVELPSLETLRNHAEGDHLETLHRLRAKGLRVDLEVQVGSPAEVIVEVAQAKHVELIAMAAHGWGGLKRWALGSVTDKVVHAAHVPVFVVRTTLELAEYPPLLRRVLVPLDGSELARQALPLASELAAAAGAELVLLNAFAPTILIHYPSVMADSSLAELYNTTYPEMRAQALANLEATAKQIHEQYGLKVTCQVCPGLPADVIIDEAKEEGADLVVMSTHGYSGLKRWTLGSVADKVLHAGHTPLLLVRATE
jgi:nucleotide-binding universal stress UspA family protein